MVPHQAAFKHNTRTRAVQRSTRLIILLHSSSSDLPTVGTPGPKWLACWKRSKERPITKAISIWAKRRHYWELRSAWGWSQSHISLISSALLFASDLEIEGAIRNSRELWNGGLTNFFYCCCTSGKTKNN